MKLGKLIRCPDVEEFPGVPQIDYEPIPARDWKIGRDILKRPGPFVPEASSAIEQSMRKAGTPVNIAITPEASALIRQKVAELIKLAAWRFFSEQQQMLAA
ncbi:hypothetical protein WI88_31030 [Burkholderia ubonensis]|nr:hypothetical protein WI88_31030 [Burkholderia ubonensis]